MNRQPIGTARALIAWAAMIAGAVCFLSDVVRLSISGLALFGVVLMLLALWLLGVFTRGFWIADIPNDHPDALGSLDLAERAYPRQEDQ